MYIFQFGETCLLCIICYEHIMSGPPLGKTKKTAYPNNIHAIAYIEMVSLKHVIIDILLVPCCGKSSKFISLKNVR